MISREEREALIQEWLDQTSIPREYAEEFVAIGLGEIDGDIMPSRPLTATERERIGLGITVHEAMARMDRRAKELAGDKSGA